MNSSSLQFFVLSAHPHYRLLWCVSNRARMLPTKLRLYVEIPVQRVRARFFQTSWSLVMHARTATVIRTSFFSKFRSVIFSPRLGVYPNQVSNHNALARSCKKSTVFVNKSLFLVFVFIFVSR